MLEACTQSLRHGLRTLRRNPTFAAAALLMLALGIGANTAVFSVVNAILVRPLPYPEPEALVGILTLAPGAPGAIGLGDLPESASMFVTYSEQNRSFQSIGIWSPFSSTVTGLAEPEQVRTVVASRGVLEALGVQPLRGRWFSESEYENASSWPVIVSWGYWQRRFGGDPSVVGRTMTVDSLPFQIVGVMPAGFRVVNNDPDLIIPLRFDRSQLFLVYFQYQMIARLKPGVTFEQADADLARLATVWGDSWGMPPGFGTARRPFESWRITPIVRSLKDDVVGGVGRTLWVLMGTIGIVLLIACANVANLVLVRAEGRQQELAMRAALGAGWRRLARDLLRADDSHVPGATRRRARVRPARRTADRAHRFSRVGGGDTRSAGAGPEADPGRARIDPWRHGRSAGDGDADGRSRTQSGRHDAVSAVGAE
jgi:predicted permease